MDFKKIFTKQILFFLSVSLVVLVVGVVIWQLTPKSNSSVPDNFVNLPASQDGSMKDAPIKLAAQNPSSDGPTSDPDTDEASQDDAAIQGQLDRDRQEQKQTKYLKTKLEQTELEYEQQKAIAEINKLKMADTEGFKVPDTEDAKSIPDIKVEYIGGDSTRKEAILSIAGATYPVKEKSHPIDSIQVMSISDTSVTVHIMSPQDMTKTIEYRQE